MKKFFVLGVVVAAVLLIIFVGGGETVTTITASEVRSGEFIVGEKEKIVLESDSLLTIEGNLTVNGTIACDKGGLMLIVKGDVVIDRKIECNRNESAGNGDAPIQGVSLVVEGSVTLGEGAEIVSNGNIQIVSEESQLIKTAAEFNALYAEAAKPSVSGHGIGPIGGGDDEVSFEHSDEIKILSAPKTPRVTRNRFSFIPAAHAHGGVTVLLGGRIVVNTPPKGVKQIVLIDVPDAEEVHLQNLDLTGPSGRAGQDDINQNCNARGKNGEDAFRMLLRAPNVKINNVTLKLGDGGEGGDATTKKDCKPGVAMGGKGGKPSNFKMIGSESFSVEGDFIIHPGKGGLGGIATAYGKDGGASEDGGDARAQGGDGGHNNKALTVSGTVSGVANVQIGSVIGGNGGTAIANPGKGGDGTGCSKRGGNGGTATATGGKGGNASLGAGGAARTPGAEDTGGKGGDATTLGAKGGEGGDCDPTGPGGNGGKGGDAKPTVGSGGRGTNGAGADGIVQNEKGGDGGNGGDGCGPGKGGKGGNGNPPGKDGSDGKNLCVEVKKETPRVAPPETTPPAQLPPPPSSLKKVRVIGYQGKYLPVDQLIIEDEAGCGADHWHAAQGFVKATDGAFVPDPGPQCGYCKVSSCPVMEIEVSE